MKEICRYTNRSAIRAGTRARITAEELSSFSAGVETAHPGIVPLGQQRTGAAVWRIRRNILMRQGQENCGAKIIGRLAADLRKVFPEMKGLSPRNLKYEREFAEAWPEEEVAKAVAQLRWGYVGNMNIVLLPSTTSCGILMTGRVSGSCKTKDRIVAGYSEEHNHAHWYYRIQIGGIAASGSEGDSTDHRGTRERVGEVRR